MIRSLRNMFRYDSPSTYHLMLPTKAFLSTNVETDVPFLDFRVLSMIQFYLPDLRGSCVASTYSVEDGPKPVI